MSFALCGSERRLRWPVPEALERGRSYQAALEKYLAVLDKDPSNVRALTRIATLYTRRAEYETALEYAHKALDFVMYDPDANYIYGVIARRMGNLVDAKETLGWAARYGKDQDFGATIFGQTNSFGGRYFVKTSTTLEKRSTERKKEYTRRAQRSVKF